MIPYFNKLVIIHQVIASQGAAKSRKSAKSGRKASLMGSNDVRMQLFPIVNAIKP